MADRDQKFLDKMFALEMQKNKAGTRGAPGAAKGSNTTLENRKSPLKSSLTDFDIEFLDALDKKLEADPGQVTFRFVEDLYSNYESKIEQGQATVEGYNRLEGLLSKYSTKSDREGVGLIKPKYLGTKKGGRIKKRKNKIKKNYAKGGGVRPASY